jgi:signal transduction histidine kinase
VRLIPRRLRTRLFFSYAVVVASGAAAMIVVGAAVTRTVYEHRIGGFGLGLGRGQGRSNRATDSIDEAQLTEALDQSLWPALLAGAGAALAVAAVVAWFVGRRLLRPLDEVRAATRQMAAGDYDVRVAVPAELELASLAEDVNVLGQHLADTERRRSHLLGEVTHEMRTPLTVIGGHLEGLVDGVIEPDPATFALVAGETKRLERLVDDLTLLSRADEGTLTVDLSPIDLADVVESVAARFRPQFEHAGVALDCESTGPLPVRGDAHRLAQVLTNIVGNALEHTPAGGSVTILGGRDRTTWVDVTDTGDGIAADELGAIFERFHRAPNVAGRSARSGRGIGLTIARSLARAHGGDVTAASPGPGRGATFRLLLPNR